MSPNSQLQVMTVGASGPAAGLVVPELRKRGVRTRGLVHKKDDEQTARNRGAQEVVVGELDDDSAVRRALAGVDATFYIAPVTLENEVEIGKRFFAIAKDAGVRRIVFSSVIHPILSDLPNKLRKRPSRRRFSTQAWSMSFSTRLSSIRTSPATGPR